MVLTFPPTNIEDAQTIATAAFHKAHWRSSESLDLSVLPDRPQIVSVAPVAVGSGSLGVMVAVDRNNAMAESWRYAARNLAAALATILLAIVFTVVIFCCPKPKSACDVAA